MGAARAVWNAAEHPRGAGGLFSRKVVDVSEIRNSGVRGRSAFHPPRPVAERRQLKERAPSAWRSAKALYDRRDRGEQLTKREEGQISWASPTKIAEQRAKTGDAIVPRGIAAARIRAIEPAGARAQRHRTGIKKTFTGQAKVERGNYRSFTDAKGYERVESRVRRAFDWPRPGKKAAAAPPKSAPKSAPPIDTPTFSIMSDAAIRDLARSRGIEIPKRAGRNQIIKLIQGA